MSFFCKSGALLKNQMGFRGLLGLGWFIKKSSVIITTLFGVDFLINRYNLLNLKWFYIGDKRNNQF